MQSNILITFVTGKEIEYTSDQLRVATNTNTLLLTVMTEMVKQKNTKKIVEEDNKSEIIDSVKKQ